MVERFLEVSEDPLDAGQAFPLLKIRIDPHLLLVAATVQRPHVRALSKHRIEPIFW
jgi:hypothetical protein